MRRITVRQTSLSLRIHGRTGHTIPLQRTETKRWKVGQTKSTEISKTTKTTQRRTGSFKKPKTKEKGHKTHITKVGKIPETRSANAVVTEANAVETRVTEAHAANAVETRVTEAHAANAVETRDTEANAVGTHAANAVETHATKVVADTVESFVASQRQTSRKLASSPTSVKTGNTTKSYPELSEK